MRRYLLIAILSLSLVLCNSCVGVAPSGESSTAGSDTESDVEISSNSTIQEISIEESEISVDPEELYDNLKETNSGDYNARSYFAWSESDGFLLLGGDLEESVYPASITKLVTALVALEYADPSYVCTAGKELYLVASDASKMWLTVGSELTLWQLLEGLLLSSGCDAAYTIAANIGYIIDPETETASEAVSAFVREMNLWSSENGLVHSAWMNPDGYHEEYHTSCMKDLLHIGILAAENSTICRITSLASAKEYAISGETYTMTNSNSMVNPDSSYYVSNCIGLKTGTTDEAGACLLGCFQMDDGSIVVTGVFGCESNTARFDDTLVLLCEIDVIREEAEVIID